MIIPNAIETEKFVYQGEIRNTIRERLNLSDNFVVGHVGRLSYQKNHDFFCLEPFPTPPPGSFAQTNKDLAPREGE